MVREGAFRQPLGYEYPRGGAWKLAPLELLASPSPAPPPPQLQGRSSHETDVAGGLGIATYIIIVAIPVLVCFHRCVRNSLCFDDPDPPPPPPLRRRRTRRTRMRDIRGDASRRPPASRRTMSGEDDTEDDEEDGDDDVEVARAPHLGNPPSSGGSQGRGGRPGRPARYPRETISEWRRMAAFRAAIRAGSHPSEAAAAAAVVASSSRSSRSRSPNRGASRYSHRRASPGSRSDGDLTASRRRNDGGGEEAPRPASRKVIASLPTCYVGDEKWRRLHGLPLSLRSRRSGEGAKSEEHLAASVAVARDARHEEREICTICCDEVEPGEELVVLLCAHAFHADCLRPWLKIRASCPTCRQPVSRVSRWQEATLWRSRRETEVRTAWTARTAEVVAEEGRRVTGQPVEGREIAQRSRDVAGANQHQDGSSGNGVTSFEVETNRVEVGGADGQVLELVVQRPIRR